MTCFSIIIRWIVLLAITLVSECQKEHPSDVADGMGRIDKVKITVLVEELVKDCKVKQRQIHSVRELHSIFIAYDVGLVMGKIREKYKRMMTIYRMSADRRNNRSDLIPPGVRDYKTIHWILDMEMVHFLQVDVDKLIHVLETIPNKTLNSLVNKGNYGPILPTGAGLRSGISPNPIFENENDLKQHYREQYKARSGHSGNWTLDEYYGII